MDEKSLSDCAGMHRNLRAVSDIMGYSVACFRKRHQPTPHYVWLWTLAQAVNRTSGRSGSASEDDPAERGCSRSRTTLGSMPTTPGGSHMTASLGGRYDPWPVKRSTDWLVTGISATVALISVKFCMIVQCTYRPRSGQISPFGCGTTRGTPKSVFGSKFWPFDCEYLENGKSQR